MCETRPEHHQRSEIAGANCYCERDRYNQSQIEASLGTTALSLFVSMVRLGLLNICPTRAQ